MIPLSIMLLAVAATVLLFLGVSDTYVNGPVAKVWARFVLWLADARVKVTGLQNIPDVDESFIVVMNHQSNMDIPVLVHSLPLQIRFIGKIELKRIPVFGSALIKAGHFLVDRKDHIKALEQMREAGETLQRRGLSLVFAPEGTRSGTGELLPFKKGAFVMAIETGIPIVPVTLDGTRLSLPKGSLWVKKAGIDVTIHTPVATRGLNYGDRDRLMEKVRGVMEETLLSGKKAKRSRPELRGNDPGVC